MGTTEKEARINALHQLLTNTNQIAMEASEGIIPKEDYAPVRAQRMEWRKELNSLEAEQTLEDLKKARLQEVSNGCNTAITAGCDVTLSDTTTAHFSLAETDQINLTAAVTATQLGATAYPYHADGQLCKLFPAQDIQRIATAATAHKLYHTTYCNHLMGWARRAETAAELEGITYGADLPTDLAARMEEVLGNVQGNL